MPGACSRAALHAQAGLVPGVTVGMGDSGVGCFHTGAGVTLGEDSTCSAQPQPSGGTASQHMLFECGKHHLSYPGLYAAQACCLSLIKHNEAQCRLHMS